MKALISALLALPMAALAATPPGELEPIGKANWQPVPPGSSGATGVEWEAVPSDPAATAGVQWQPVKPGEPEIPPPATVSNGDAPVDTPRPQPPALQAFNRSIAFSDGVVGPDVGFLVPQGFRWSDQHFIDASIRGWNRKQPQEKFFAWNGGDGVGQLFVRVYQEPKWSFGLSLGIRSLYKGERAAGGTTQVGEGLSSGFRLDYALSDTAGIAFGAEQLIHYDSNTDTGRDIYLVASQGWWLGGTKGNFPLLVATGGVGTGYLGVSYQTQFACSNTPGGAGVNVDRYDPLCWGPIGSAALVFNPSFSWFGEYNNYAWMTGLSFAPSNVGVPIRLTWGVTFAEFFRGDYNINADENRWFFRVSMGF